MVALLIVIVAILVLLGLGLPYMFVFGVTGFIGLLIVCGWETTSTYMAYYATEFISSYSLACIPLFILMGVFGSAAKMTDDLFDVAYRHTSLGSQLAERTVVVQSGHGAEPLARDVWRVSHGNEAVGVGRVTDDDHADIGSRADIERLALSDKDGRIGAEKVGALHARSPRSGAHEERPVGALKGRFGLIGQHHVGEERKRAVPQLHGHTL